jgi:hypothetical protein
MKLTRDKISKLRRVKNQSYRRFHRKKNTDVTTTTFRKNNRAIEQLFKTVKHYVDKKFIEKHKKERIRKRLLKLQKQLGGGDDGTGTGTGMKETGTGTEIENSEIDVLPIQLNVITALETELANSSNDAASNVNSNKEQVSVIASSSGDNPLDVSNQNAAPLTNVVINNPPNTDTSQPVVNTPEKLPDIQGDVVLSVEKIKVDENFTASKVLKAENKIVQIIKDNTPISISGVSNYFTIIGLLYGKFRPPPKEEGGANEPPPAEFDLGVGMSVGIGTKSTPDGMFIKHLPDIVKKITDKSSDVSIKVASEDGSNEEGVKPGQIYFINDANKAAVITNTNDKNKIGIEALTTKDAFRILLTPYETKQKEGVEQGEIPTKYFYNINDGEEITIVDTLKTLFEEIRKEMAVTDNDKKEKTMENLEKLLKIVKERKHDSEFIDAVKDFKYTAGYDPYGIQLSFKSIKESGLTAHISKVISIENELGIGEQSSEFFPNDKNNMKITIEVGNDADENTKGEIEDLVEQFEKIAAKAEQEENARQNEEDKKTLEGMENQVNNDATKQNEQVTSSTNEKTENNTIKPTGGAKHTRRNKKTSYKKTRNNRK